MSRTERPRNTKIGTEVAHITHDLDTIFKVKRSKLPGHFTRRRVGTSGSCSGGCGNVLAVRNCCYVAVCSAAQGASGRREAWAYRSSRPPTAQGAPWSWKVMEFRKTIFQAWKVMENRKGHEKSWKMMIMSCNFYYCTEQFCKSDTTSFIKSNYEPFYLDIGHGFLFIFIYI